MRSGAGRAEPAARRGRSAAGPRGTRSSSSSRIVTRRAAGETSPRPIESGRIWPIAACCSRMGRPGHAGKRSEDVLSVMTVPLIKTDLPGPRARAIIERDRAVVSPSYTRGYPFVMERGLGAVVEDVDGNVFLDCTAGIAVTATGHSHPDVVRAVTEQAQRFLHMSGTDFYYELQVKLAEELAAVAPMDGGVRSFFCNSGAEAIEACIKLSRYATTRHQSHRVSRRVSRTNARRAVADRQQGRAAPRVRADDARCVSRAVSQLLSLSARPDARDLRGGMSRLHRAGTVRAPRVARRGGGDCASSRFKAKAATSWRPISFSSGCAR